MSWARTTCRQRRFPPAVPRFRREVGGGLMLGFVLPSAARAAAWISAPAGALPGKLNAFVNVRPDGSVTFIMPKSEMGQGVYTGLSQLLAEELECDIAAVRIETAPVAAVYNNPFVPAQFTGGSMSISSSWQALRVAGAAARTMLIEAAAKKWGVDAGACRAERNFVYGPDGRRAGYGELAAAAGKIAPPDPKSVRLKSPSRFSVIGKPVPRVEIHEKVDGSGKFGLDVRVPGMLRAVLARPPKLGATPKNIDDKAALKVSGVVRIVPLSVGVAVVAKNTYAARKGRDALVVDWQALPDSTMDTDKLRAEYLELSQAAAPAVARNDGDAVSVLQAGGGKRLDAVYEVPYLSHASMEPLNCVAHWRPDRCDVWTGTQMQSPDRAAAAEVAGLPHGEDVHSYDAVRRRLRPPRQSGQRFRARGRRAVAEDQWSRANRLDPRRRHARGLVSADVDGSDAVDARSTAARFTRGTRRSSGNRSWRERFFRARSRTASTRRRSKAPPICRMTSRTCASICTRRRRR